MDTTTEPDSSPLATPPRVLRPQRAVPTDTVRPTRAEVNLSNLRHNLRVLETAAEGARVWAVLKADAYGHGSKAVARTLERAGLGGVCVALVEEAIELREAGIRLPILVMGGYFGNAWGEVLHYQLTPVLHDPGQVEALAREVRFRCLPEPARVHLKIDTGMSRLGVRPDDVQAVAATLAQSRELMLEGLMTHFANADALDGDSVAHQLELFNSADTTLKGHGVTASLRHAANSAALLTIPRSRMDLVRPGIAIFGVSPMVGATSELRAVMRVRTDVVAVREIPAGQSVGYGGTWTSQRTSQIATIPIGYADGFSRALSNRGSVLIRGRRAPIVGIVSMDMTMVDVTEIPGAQPGDDCVVLGQQKGPLGQGEITAEEISEQMGSIPWEVLTSVSRRVPRFYREP
jgi:alanine racemase